MTDFGLEWAIIGHSERRVKYGEKDDVLAQKVALAQAEKLNVPLGTHRADGGAVTI